MAGWSQFAARFAAVPSSWQAAGERLAGLDSFEAQKHRPRRPQSAPCMGRQQQAPGEQQERMLHAGLEEVLRPGLRTGSTFVPSVDKAAWQQAGYDHSRPEHPVFNLADTLRSNDQADAGAKNRGRHFVFSSDTTRASPQLHSCFLSAGHAADEAHSGWVQLSNVLRPGVRSGTFVSSAGDALSSPSRISFLSTASPSSSGSSSSPGLRGGFVELSEILRPEMRSVTSVRSGGGSSPQVRENPQEPQSNRFKDTSRQSPKKGCLHASRHSHESEESPQQASKRRSASVGAASPTWRARARQGRARPHGGCHGAHGKIASTFLDPSPGSPNETRHERLARRLRFHSCSPGSKSV